MTINELLERLEEYREEIGGDAEARLMTQQNWPFEYDITGLASAAEMRDLADDEDTTDDNVLYIVEGRQLGYGSKEAWEVAR